MKTNEIINGNAYDLIKQLPDGSIDAIYTDIPYEFEAGDNSSQMGLQTRLANRKAELNAIRMGIDYTILDQFLRVLKKVNLFIWCSKSQVPEIFHYILNRLPGLYYEIIVWTKNNPTPTTNQTWLPDVEYCLYFRQKGVVLNDGYELKSKWWNSSINKDDKDDYGHPTIKPLELVKRHLLHTTQPGDIVLDPFSGSGTTAIAAIETGRKFIAYELDERYHQISINRLHGVKQSGQTSLFAPIDLIQGE
jgi:DNA modification methylase